jgi:anti-sigma factor RsiW
LAENGFPLVGGQLDVLDGRSVAVLVYGRRKHYIQRVYCGPAAVIRRFPPLERATG